MREIQGKYDINRKNLGITGEGIAKKELEKLGFETRYLWNSLFLHELSCEKLKEKFIHEKLYLGFLGQEEAYRKWLNFCKENCKKSLCFDEVLIELALMSKEIGRELELEGISRTDRILDFIASKNNEVYLIEVKVNTSRLWKGQKMFIKRAKEKLGIDTLFIHINIPNSISYSFKMHQI